MKKVAALVVVLLLTAALSSVSHAETLMTIVGKSYNLEVCSMEMVTSLNGKYQVLKKAETSGRKSAVNEITLEYDYETEGAERIDKFSEDAPIALVYVDGFDASIAGIRSADEVVVTVNGLPIAQKEEASYDEYVGWLDINHDESMSVVFPVVLTKEGGIENFTVRVQAIADDVRVTETAQIAVKLVNTHEYKEEREARIVMIEGENVDAYIVGEKIYLDHPKTAVGTQKVTLTFADENGALFEEIIWAEDTVCKAEGEKAALHLEKPVRLDAESEAEYSLDSGCTQDRRSEVVFELETKDVLYMTKKYDIVERFDVPAEDPKGIYFAENLHAMRVGEAYYPVVVGVKTAKPVCTNLAGTLQILAGENTDVQVLDVSDGKTVIATRPGTAYITARYVMGEQVYDALSMKIVVSEEKVQTHTVLCRNLNVRASAGTDAEKVGMLHRGDEVTVVNVDGGWAQLADGTFVAVRYIV